VSKLTEANYKKGTTTVGMIFKGGLVLASDQRASLGHLSMHKVPKVFKVAEFIGITTAGAVSDAQNLLKYLKAEMELYKLDRNKEPSIDVAASLLGTIAYGGRQSFFPYMVQILLGGRDDESDFKLFSIFGDGSVIIDKYTCSGSGMELALATLDDAWKEGMSEKEAVALAVKAINKAIKRDIYSGDGISVAVINENGYKDISDTKAVVLEK